MSIRFAQRGQALAGKPDGSRLCQITGKWPFSKR